MKKKELKLLVHQQAATIQRLKKENNQIRKVFDNTKKFLQIEISKLTKPGVKNE